MCIFFQVIDYILDVESQRILVKGTGGHLFRFREFFSIQERNEEQDGFNSNRFNSNCRLKQNRTSRIMNKICFISFLHVSLGSLPRLINNRFQVNQSNGRISIESQYVKP